MTEQPPSSEPETRVQAQAGAPAGNSGGESAALLDQRPEIGVGAAFAGGFVLAMILKRLGR